MITKSELASASWKPIQVCNKVSMKTIFVLVRGSAKSKVSRLRRAEKAAKQRNSKA